MVRCISGGARRVSLGRSSPPVVAPTSERSVAVVGVARVGTATAAAFALMRLTLAVFPVAMMALAVFVAASADRVREGFRRRSRAAVVQPAVRHLADDLAGLCLGDELDLPRRVE
ncbi:hypothetical protein [Anaeromyxobacter terrae]|uniref:hypothetical protein n=1 Tax=Anaeromyxobacter terrae TaxID=2925406 RepID=UPI001F5A5170|nr:hypothetical protein [Anaeromyxobacter sp. SG22]